MGGSSKKQTVGYKYYLGAHMGICHGPIDKITRIRVSDRTAWVGESTGGTITVDSPKLFGGEEREGGISGAVDFDFGATDQTVNAYLNSVQPVASETIPAYRGICSAVLNQVYLGTNPYLKPWEFRAQRIHTSTRGAVQWYDSKSEVPGEFGDILSSYDLDTTSLVKSIRSVDVLGVNAGGIGSQWSDDGLTFYWCNGGPGARIYQYDASIANDLDTLTYTGKSVVVAGVDSNITGFSFSSDFSKLFLIGLTNGRAHQFTLITPGDVSTAVFSSSSTGAWSSAFGIRLSDDEAKLYILRGVNSSTGEILQYSTLLGGVSDIVFDSSFNVAPFISGIPASFDFSNDGTYLFVSSSGSSVSSFLLNSGWDIGSGLSFLKDTDLSVSGPLNVSSLHGIRFKYDNTSFFITARFQSGDTGGVSEWAMDSIVQSGDMNPAHIIRECITDNNWGMGYTSSDIDDTSFTAAADTLFNEEFGMSLLWSQDDKIEEFIQDVLRHIDGLLYINPRTGKFTLKLIRDDYVAASLPILDESNIISINDYEKPTIGELTNYVTVKYWDRSTSQNASISVQDIALAQQQGSVVPASVTFPGITRGELASRVASRTLSSLSNPIIACSIIADRNASSLNIGDAFKLSWAKFGLTETIMRVTNISFGTLTNGQVKIDCIQDVFALPQATFSSPTDSGFTTPTNAPANSPYRLVDEVNYWTLIQDQGEDFTFNELDGWLLTAAVRPSSDALNYRVWTDESGSYDEKESADFCPTATITADFPKATSGVINVTVGLSGLDADDVADIDIGSPCQIGNEIMSVVSLTTTEGTFGRAVIDSPIEDHLSGDRIFFWGNSFYGGSTELYQDSDTIGVKITPSTAQGQLDVADATAESLTFDQRPYRAWLPGNVKLNSVYFPTYIENTTVVDSSWAHRDRTLQTAGLVDFDEASIGPEAGTTYTTTLIRVNNSVVLDTNTGLTGTTDSLDTTGYDGLVRYEIKSIRDSLDSYFTHTHELPVTRTSFILTEQGDFILTEDGEYLVTES